ncbi:hypothetical protein EPA93_18440 [Ktedonosporobacter rubrisoli]|uniref:Uncharacterized protein n=1 Tax=Ktedonosporobacter rubrisoli TaxID=2509675 RepID=A0A4P6JRE1_KTERU|nr:hypothetical protein [Ktedonosporobacter rubrisoli]QBD77863.1 hypothetical protein EPA93_18440 [Ktedonosporobacter rubrisoli]
MPMPEQTRSHLWHFRRCSLSVRDSVFGLVMFICVLGLAGTLWASVPVVKAWQSSANGKCTLIVPANPLSAKGLATPYLLKATDPNQGPCHEANADQSAFVQAAILRPSTGSIAIYNPLVIDKGSQPARNPKTGKILNPVMPDIPSDAVIGIWFGYNGDTLTLEGANGDTLSQANCVFGAAGSPFGQFAYCNAVNFFSAAHSAINNGKLTPPRLGTGDDHLVCPSVRDFFIVDQDQSDNVTATYLKTNNGRIAQNTAENARVLQDTTLLVNPSDNYLLAERVDPALGCTPWRAPDLANPGHSVSALPLNELQASLRQAPPVALVPSLDPMVLIDTTPNLDKLNAYRRGVDQPTVSSVDSARTKDYCLNLQQVAPARLRADAELLGRSQSDNPAVGNTLFTFMAQRYVNTFTLPVGTGLNCQKMFNLQPRVVTQQNKDGVAVSAIITFNGKGQCFNSRGEASSMDVCNQGNNN